MGSILAFLELRSGLKGLEANQHWLSKGPLRRISKPGLILILFMLISSGSGAWSQREASVSAPAAVDSAPAGAPQVQEPAQEQSSASIRGVVASKDGELFEGAHVALVLLGPGTPPARSQATDSDGAFNFADLPSGAFKLTISSSGFVDQTVSGFLHQGEIFDARTIVLPMNSATTEVEVTASQEDIAVEQLHQEEHQRVLGIIPNFYVTYVPDAPPLTTRQKYALAWRSSIDPISWLANGAFAGMEQADNTFRGYGQGAQGYAKRFGAGYADSFISTMIGGAILPATFKQDPRYFYKGTGTVRSRVLYALANAIICKGDNGHWQFDYSGILGSLAAGGISNIYYPASSRRGVALTFEGTGLGIAGSSVGNLFQEFLVRKLTPRVPHYAPPLQ